jgi:hypothetical protein
MNYKLKISLLNSLFITSILLVNLSQLSAQTSEELLNRIYTEIGGKWQKIDPNRPSFVPPLTLEFSDFSLIEGTTNEFSCEILFYDITTEDEKVVFKDGLFHFSFSQESDSAPNGKVTLGGFIEKESLYTVYEYEENGEKKVAKSQFERKK